MVQKGGTESKVKIKGSEKSAVKCMCVMGQNVQVVLNFHNREVNINLVLGMSLLKC